MKYTHAPEPWIVTIEGNLYGDGMYIGNISDDHNDEQTEANRSLICAAPALLSALELAADELDQWIGNDYADEKTHAAQNAARAAIAKAKGGASC